MKQTRRQVVNRIAAHQAEDSKRILLWIVFGSVCLALFGMFGEVKGGQRILAYITSFTLIVYVAIIWRSVQEANRDGAVYRVVIEIIACACALITAGIVFPLAFFLMAMSSDSPMLEEDHKTYYLTAVFLVVLFSPAGVIYFVIRYLLLKLV
jgi:hypothetical protein